MSSIALIVTLLLAVMILAGAYWIRERYRLALTSVLEKQGGVVVYYRGRLYEIFRGQGASTEHLICLFHYVLLHLFTPFCLAVFLLHTDANFMIAVGGILVSLHLLQRIFPGESVL